MTKKAIDVSGSDGSCALPLGETTLKFYVLDTPKSLALSVRSACERVLRYWLRALGTARATSRKSIKPVQHMVEKLCIIRFCTTGLMAVVDIWVPKGSWQSIPLEFDFGFLRQRQRFLLQDSYASAAPSRTRLRGFRATATVLVTVSLRGSSPCDKTRH